MSRGVMLVRSSVVKVFNLFLSIAISFYMMPFLVGNLGDRMYGMWALLGSILGYYGVMDLGLSSAVSRFFSRAVGRNDAEEIKKIASTSFYLFVGLGLFCILTSVCVANYLKYVIQDPQDLRLVQILILLLTINFAVDFPVRTFNAAFSSNLREDLSSLINIVRTVANAAAIYIVIKKGYGLLGMTIVTVSVSMIDSAARVAISYRIEPNMCIHPAYFERSKIFELFNYSVYTLIGRIANILKLHLDRLVITAYLSLSSVTHFTVGSRLIEYLSSLMQQFFLGTIPFHSQDEGKNDFAAIRRNFLFFTRVSVFLSMYFGGIALLYGKTFIMRWMGTGYGDGGNVLIILLIPYILDFIQMPLWTMLMGISKHKYSCYTGLTEGILNLALSIYWVQKYGIYGVALGTAVPMMLRTVFVAPIYGCDSIGMPLKNYIIQVSRDMLYSFLLLGAGWSICSAFSGPAYVRLLGCVTLNTLVYWPLIIVYGFDQAEKEKLFNAISKTALFEKIKIPFRSRV